MNTPKFNNFEVQQGPIFEPFPEPRTMPEGWDLSEFGLNHEGPNGQPEMNKYFALQE